MKIRTEIQIYYCALLPADFPDMRRLPSLWKFPQKILTLRQINLVLIRLSFLNHRQTK